MNNTDKTVLIKKIEEATAAFDGTIAMSFHELAGDFRIDLNQDKVMRIASVGKLFILGCLLEKCQRGEADLTDTVTIRKEDLAGGSGLLQYLTPGLNMSIRDLALLMIIVSDNTATNLVLAYVGGAKVVQEHLLSHGIKASKVNRRIAMTEEEVKAGCFAEGTTAELAEYLRQIEEGEILQASWLAVWREMLERQQYKNMLLRNLPLSDYYEEERADLVRSGSKTGFDGNTRCDAGWLILPDGRKFVYAVTAGGGRDESYGPDNEAELVMAAIGKRLHEALVCEN